MKELTRDIILMIYQFAFGSIMGILSLTHNSIITGRAAQVAQALQFGKLGLCSTLLFYLTFLGIGLMFAQRRFLFKPNQHIYKPYNHYKLHE